MQGKVSMVVPCYNKEDYIGATLDSILAQEWDNIELILVNDGSTDGTRGIIAEYEPRFLERGYEIVIVDQENGGCCAAVYAGLLRMTGDYFCLIDADDEIKPEYCSRMAGWLDEHDDYEWAACSYQRVVTDGEKRVVEPRWQTAAPQDTTRLVENYILRRVITMAWIYMMRVQYVKHCGLLEAFCTERRATYEPCIAVPPASAGGRLKFFDEPLYVYNVYASDLFRFSVFEDAVKYYGDYLYLFKWTIERLSISEKKKQQLIGLASLTHKHQLSNYLNIPNGERHRLSIAEQTSAVLDEILTPPPRIKVDEILKVGFGSLFETARSLILDLEKELLEKLKNARRIIGYGALGKRGEKDLPLLLSASISPTVLWDNGLDENKTMCGITVTKPEFATLTSEDAVIVFPNSAAALEEIRFLLDNSGAGTVLYRKDLMGLYSLAKFPSLLGCELKFDKEAKK